MHRPSHRGPTSPRLEPSGCLEQGILVTPPIRFEVAVARPGAVLTGMLRSLSPPECRRQASAILPRHGLQLHGNVPPGGRALGARRLLDRVEVVLNEKGLCGFARAVNRLAHVE